MAEKVLEDEPRHAGALSCDAGTDILEEEGHAIERATRFSIIHGLSIEIYHGIERGIAGCDPLPCGVQHLVPAELSVSDGLGQPCRIIADVISGFHAAPESFSDARYSLRIACSTSRCNAWNSGDATIS